MRGGLSARLQQIRAECADMEFTVKDLAEKLDVSVSRASVYVALLRRKLHVVEWRLSGTYWVPVYAFGYLPDAIKPLRRRQSRKNIPRKFEQRSWFTI